MCMFATPGVSRCRATHCICRVLVYEIMKRGVDKMLSLNATCTVTNYHCALANDMLVKKVIRNA